MDNNQEAFFALLRAGLWESDVHLSSINKVDYQAVYRLSEEQSVVGLVAAGIEHVIGIKVPQDVSLKFAGQTLQLEQRNNAMNHFIDVTVDKMREKGIYVLILKGQGIAQCYVRPLWRTCGDVDFFSSQDNYNKAKEYLTQSASHIDVEREDTLHLGMTIDSWVVELHGSLRCGLSKRIDKGLDEIQEDIIYGGSVRSWIIGGNQVLLPRTDEDAIFVFTHILEHFYKGGIGLRQICDWCRLLWTYRSSLNVPLLEKRLKQMGLQTQWRGFGAFSVDYLGIPPEAMPLYSSDKKWSRKAKRICAFVLEVGNFGKNRDNRYYTKYPFLIRKIYSFGRRCGDLFRHMMIFPLDSIRFFPSLLFNGLNAVIKGERLKFHLCKTDMKHTKRI
jgi:hypothetical protein